MAFNLDFHANLVLKWRELDAICVRATTTRAKVFLLSCHALRRAPPFLVSAIDSKSEQIFLKCGVGQHAPLHSGWPEPRFFNTSVQPP